MTDYYVGIGGNDGNTGLSWAQRFLTLNAAEDEPVVADDTVYVGPGTYREQLTVDVSGGAGTEIVYIGDVTGENTDGVGGIVRITGSDNDQDAARSYCITSDGFDYRIFRGFSLDTTSGLDLFIQDAEHWDIEDCVMQNHESGNCRVQGPTINDINFRRCLFLPTATFGVSWYETAGVADANSLMENCVVIQSYEQGIISREVAGITVRNCYISGYYGFELDTSPPGGYTAIVIENCLFNNCRRAIAAQAVGEIAEDYNNFCAVETARINTNVGGNSTVYATLLLPPILHSGASQVSGFAFPWLFGALSEWSELRAITGSNEPTEDFYGIERPVTASKNSWGAHQFMDAERDTGTTRGASTASLTLHDAGRHQIWVPVEASSTTISVYVYREANYAGGNPQMIVKQPDQADDVTTDAAAASQWNLLTTTLTPAADPPYVVVELVSENTAAAGNYDIFFDDLTVS